MFPMLPHTYLALSLLSFALLAGCRGALDHGGRSEVFVQGTQLELFEIDTLGAHGLSGLAFDGERLWSVPERQRKLISWAVERTHSGKFSLGEPVLSDLDLPLGDDTESLGWLGGRRFALGLEGQAESRKSDRVLWVEGSSPGSASAASTGVPSTFRVTGEQTLRYAAWKMRAPGNQGIEALCYAQGELFVACEPPLEQGGFRLAPFAGYDPRTQRWAYGWIRLTSGTGKISALDCSGVDAAGAQRLQFYAIERHYGTLRILEWQLPAHWLERTWQSAAGQAGHALEPAIEPHVVLRLDGKLPADANPEGLAWVRSRNELLVVTDNQSGAVTGPTRLLRIALGASPQ
jgi:hypothetical protein